jgi:hypothetical protein
MSVYLQFDSTDRSDPYIQRDLGAGLVWVPNDRYPNTAAPPFNFYQTSSNLVQSPARYRVFYRELNEANNVRTIGFLAHCKERATNLTYSVEGCTLIVPSTALVARDNDGTTEYISVLNEPYLFVRMMPINHAEGNLIYSNNRAADEATFMVWCDKLQSGTNIAGIPNPPARPPEELPLANVDATRWVTYKTCMITIMRLDLQAEEWQIRIYDRFGNDIVVPESDNSGAGFTGAEPPAVDPELQTTLLVGIKPNYPL